MPKLWQQDTYSNLLCNEKKRFFSMSFNFSKNSGKLFSLVSSSWWIFLPTFFLFENWFFSSVLWFFQFLTDQLFHSKFRNFSFHIFLNFSWENLTKNSSQFSLHFFLNWKRWNSGVCKIDRTFLLKNGALFCSLKIFQIQKEKKIG